MGAAEEERWLSVTGCWAVWTTMTGGRDWSWRGLWGPLGSGCFRQLGQEPETEAEGRVEKQNGVGGQTEVTVSFLQEQPVPSLLCRDNCTILAMKAALCMYEHKRGDYAKVPGGEGLPLTGGPAFPTELRVNLRHPLGQAVRRAADPWWPKHPLPPMSGVSDSTPAGA